MKNKLILMLILISTIFLMPIKNVDVGNKNLKLTNDIVSPLTVTKSDEFRGYEIHIGQFGDGSMFDYTSSFLTFEIKFIDEDLNSENSQLFWQFYLDNDNGNTYNIKLQNVYYKIPLKSNNNFDFDFFWLLNNFNPSNKDSFAKNNDPHIVILNYPNFEHSNKYFFDIYLDSPYSDNIIPTIDITSDFYTKDELVNLFPPKQPENLTRSIVTFDDFYKQDAKGNLTLGYKIENQGYDTIIPDNQLNVDVENNVINLGNIDDIEKGTTKTFDIKYSEKYNFDSDYAENLNEDFKISIEGNPIPAPSSNNKIYTYILIVIGILITIILMFSLIIFKRFKSAIA